MGYRTYSLSWEVLWKCSEEAHYLSNPVALLIPSLTPPSLLEEGVQTEVRLGNNPTLQHLQNFNQAQAELESKLSEKAQKLEHKYNAQQIKMERRHEQEWARMAQEGDCTLQEVFSMVSLAESVKLLPWCFSTGAPFAIWMTHWPLWATEQNCSSHCRCNWARGTICSRAIKQSNSLTQNSSSYHTSSAGSTFWGHPFHRAPILWVPCQPFQAKVGPLSQQLIQWLSWEESLDQFPEVEVRSEHSSTQDDDYTPNLMPETRTSLGDEDRSPPAPPSSPIRALANPDDEAVAGSPKSTRDQTSSDSGSSRGNMADSNLDTASGNCLSCSDTDEVSIWDHSKEIQKKSKSIL